jgi:hypothetical protein
VSQETCAFINVLLNEIKSFPSISFLSKADFVLFPLSTLIAKPTTHSLYAMGFSFTTSVGPNAIFGFLRLFYTNPSQILESLTDFCVDFLFPQLITDSNIYTSVEYLHRCRRRISSNIAACGGLLGQGSVDGVVGSGTIGGVGVTTGSGCTDEKTSTSTRR